MKKYEKLELEYLDIINRLKNKNLDFIKSEEVELHLMNEDIIKCIEKQCSKLDKLRVFKT